MVFTAFLWNTAVSVVFDTAITAFFYIFVKRFYTCLFSILLYKGSIKKDFALVSFSQNSANKSVTIAATTTCQGQRCGVGRMSTRPFKKSLKKEG